MVKSVFSGENMKCRAALAGIGGDSPKCGELGVLAAFGWRGRIPFGGNENTRVPTRAERPFSSRFIKKVLDLGGKTA